MPEIPENKPRLYGGEYYEDIIHLPRHVSIRHPHMPPNKRAAQFAPFDALEGYRDQVTETRRLTDQKINLDEDAREALTCRLTYIEAMIDTHPQVSLTYFVADKLKAGGAYVTTTGPVKKIDMVKRAIVLLAENGRSDGDCIPMDEIIAIDGELFPEGFGE